MSTSTASPPTAERPAARRVDRRRGQRQRTRSLAMELVGPPERAVVRLAAVMIVVQLAVRAWVGLQGYFLIDDYAFVARAGRYALTSPEYLFTYYAGHLMPGSMVWVWVASRIDAYNFGLVVATLVLAQLLASVLVLRMLRVLFGDRPLILVPLALYLFSPLTLPSFLWWSAAINALPLQIGLALAITAHVRYLQTGRRRHIATAAASIAGALLFFEKSVLIIPLLVGISWIWDTSSGPLRSLARALRTQWAAWLSYLALLTGYAAFYLQFRGRWTLLAPPPLTLPSVPEVWHFLVLGTTTALLPGIAGGPLAWAPTVEIALPSSPHWLPTVACWSVALLVVGSAWRSRRARRAWVVCAGYLVGNAVLFALGRPNSGALFAQTRYWADPLLVFATCLALATMPLRLAPSDRTRALPRPWVHPLGAMRVPLFALVVVAVTTATVVSTTAFLAVWQRSQSRAWMTSALASLRAVSGSGQTLLDNVAPGDVVAPWLYPWKQYSWAFSAVRDRPPITQVSWDLLTFDEQGALVPGRIEGPGWVGVRCLATGETELTLPLSALAYPWVHQAHLRFYAPEPVGAEVTLDNQPVSLELVPGHNDVYFTIQGGGTSFRISRHDVGRTLCVSVFQVGAVVPSGGPG